MDWSTPQGRLVWARDNSGLSRREVSERTGLGIKLIEAQENGRNLARGLAAVHAGKYARAYGVSEAWLATGIGEPVGARGGLIRVSVRGRLTSAVYEL